MTADPTILAARARAVAAKARLDASVAHAKARLSPASLASDAVDSAKDKAVTAARGGLRVARDRPAATAAVVGAVGLVLARKRILEWIGAPVRRRPPDG